MNLIDVLRGTVGRVADKPAVVKGNGEAVTYARLLADVSDLASRLAASGVGPSSCVGLHVQSGYEYIISVYAIWNCGASVAPVAVELSVYEKRDVLARLGVTHIMDGALGPSVFDEATTKAVPLGHGLRASSVRRPKPHPEGFLDVNPAFLRFTSGTTGDSKGVVLSHESVLARCVAANRVLNIGPDDRVVWLLSMSYHFTVSIVSYLSFGATIGLCDSPFGVAMARVTESIGGTIIYGAPMHYARLLAHADPKLMEGVRLPISTTTALDDHVSAAFFERYGKPLVQAYGIIEVGLPCINVVSARAKPHSVGRVVAGYEMEFRDCGLGDERKSIRIRGEGTLDAYYSPWRPRSEITVDGWFETGDLGYMDRDGDVIITGRAKELIDVGGLKFFPQEVEEVLETFPGVAEACVFGDPGQNGAPVARLALKLGAAPTPAQLVAHCRDRLANYKVPVHFDLLPPGQELPRTASGKRIRRA